MFERFSDAARKVMSLAQQYAKSRGHEYVGTEDLLVGLTRLDFGVTTRLWGVLDIKTETILREIEKVVVDGPNGPVTGESRLPLAPRAKAIVEYALTFSRETDQNYVGTAALLIGCLRAKDGVAAQVLANQGVDEAKVLAAYSSLRGITQDLPGAKYPLLCLTIAAADLGRLQGMIEPLCGPTGAATRLVVRITEQVLAAARTLQQPPPPGDEACPDPAATWFTTVAMAQESQANLSG